MAIANLPSNLDNIIQSGFLERRFEDNLQASLGYRDLAERIVFPNNVGETVTRTRPGLLAPVTTPMNPATVTNLDDGLSPQYWSVEQFTLAINEYAATLDLNILTQKVGIADQFLKNASRLGEQAFRSLDLLNQANLFNAYMGGNTRVTATLGAPATTIAADDIRGFQYAIPTSGDNSGKPNIPVSGSNTMPVQVDDNIYTLVGATADVTNTSTAFGGISGTLTFSTNVSVNDGTAGNAVISAYAPTIVRPNNRLTTALLQSSDILSLNQLGDAVTILRNNNVPTFENGYYRLVMSPASWNQLRRDPEYQLLFRGTEFRSTEYRNYIPAGAILDCDIVISNMAPQQTLGLIKVQRPVLCGRECLIEGEFEGMTEIMSQKYGSNDLYETHMANGVAMVTRGQLDRLKQIIAQSWFFVGGWCAPTDQTINSTVMPTATAAYYKRAVIIETA